MALHPRGCDSPPGFAMGAGVVLPIVKENEVPAEPPTRTAIVEVSLDCCTTLIPGIVNSTVPSSEATAVPSAVV